MLRIRFPAALACGALLQAQAQALPDMPPDVPQAAVAPAIAPVAVPAIAPVAPPALPPRFPAPPIVPRADSEVLHGVTVADPFRWLEQQDSAEVQAIWSYVSSKR